MDIDAANSILKKIVNKKPWGVKLGIGSFLTIEFGKKLVENQQEIESRGEWHLWLYDCAWRIEKNNKLIVGSQDDIETIKKQICLINGLTVTKAKILNYNLDTVFEFSHNFRIRTFSVNTDSEHWMLFFPDGYVLSLEKIDNILYEKE